MITAPRIPRLPDISHVQFFTLESLMVCPLPGKELRSELHEVGWARSQPTFHELTKRLEERGLIRGFYVRKFVGFFSIRERHFEITVAGVRAYHEAQAFYSNGAAVPVS